MKSTAAGSREPAATAEAGKKVAAAHDGSFLFADSNAVDFNSMAADEFAVRSTGGATFVTAINTDGSTANGVTVGPNEGSWSTASARDSKKNFSSVAGRLRPTPSRGATGAERGARQAEQRAGLEARHAGAKAR